MAIFSVALNGICAGQDIVNVLYYRTVSPIVTIADFLDYAAAIAAEVDENIWDRASGDDMRFLLPDDYTLTNITVNGMDDDGVQLTTTPYVRPVNETGSNTVNFDTPALCAILKFNLEPAFGPGVGLPTRGYLALGPLSNDDVASSGLINAANLITIQGVANRFAENIITVAPVGTFFPVRIRINPTGLPFPLGYRDISSVAVRPAASFRKSRMPTG